MSIRVTDTLDDLESDLKKIARQAPRDMVRTVRANAQRGNRLAKNFARESAGEHGKHYHKAFSFEAISPLVWEYGPDSAMPQGGMSFEGGSMNQPAHNDLEKSQDITGPMFAKDVSRLADHWFWPAS